MTLQQDQDRIRLQAKGRLGDFQLDVKLAVPAMGITAIFGPSGAGKSTVLGVLSGLTRFDGGQVFVGETCWQDEDAFVPSHQRALGYVFQEARLFPHLSVMDNLTFGYKRAPEPRVVSIDRAVALMGLESLTQRRIGALSGGERQRVAIGRALLAQPQVLLMDEPLSALDQNSRREILPRLRVLQAELSAPIIYVTHDMSEVERLADWLVLMDKGCVTASGPLAQLQADTNMSLARRREAVVTLEAELTNRDKDYGLSQLKVSGGAFWLPDPGGALGDRRRVQISASDVSFTLSPHKDTTILNVLPARIADMSHVDDFQTVVGLCLGTDGHGARILGRVTRKSIDMLGLAPGMTVHAQVKGAALVD